MNGYNFTDRVRKTLQLSREEATRLNHEYVGTEHILLGILREGEGVAAAVLADLDVSLEQLRQRVETTVKPGRSPLSPRPDLPYTSHAKKVLEFAMAEARQLGQSFVGTEHLLLGLLHLGSSPAGQTLAAAGVTLEKARAVATRLRAREPSRPSAGAPDRQLSAVPLPADPTARRALVIALVALAVAIVALILALGGHVR
jgi:ATP-dependent Clp protease ATP-binding subunit ClpC